MKRILFIVVLLVMSVGVASAQSVASQRQKLESRSADGSVVHIHEESQAAAAVTAVDSQTKRTKVSGYRVVIYFNNGQYAGDKAQGVLSSFRAKYPHINAYLVYESPYFKVSVGDCLTMEEAIILMNAINHDYPKAFPKREDITVAELKNVRKGMDVVQTDTLSTAVPAPMTTLISQ